VGALAVGPDDEGVVAFATANAWRIVVVPRPHTPTVALRWLVAAGGRHDGVTPGLSHLTQRLVFGAQHSGRRDLLQALDALGAEVGAQTTREYAEFHAVIAAPHGVSLLALVPELARQPLLDPEEVARQKQAIHAGFATEPPARGLWDLLHEALWGNHPLAQPPQGTPPTVELLPPRTVAEHHRAHYSPQRTVLAIAGACTLDEVRAAAALIPPTQDPPPSPQTPPVFAGPRTRYRWSPAEVAHVAAAVPAPGMTHPDRSALRLLDYTLGRGGSARLYRELREARGLVYTCGSLFMPYADVGLFAAQATCAPESAPTVAALLAEHLLGLGQQPPTQAEMRAAQRRYTGALHRAFETNASLTSLVGVEALLASRESFADSIARIQSVTLDELATVARHYCTAQRLVGACIGPVDPWPRSPTAPERA
jgi:predicted Zn-dependent peptidase